MEDAITTSRETGTSNDSAESSRKELEAKFADRISRYLKQQQVGANQRIEEAASEISAAAAAYYEASVSFPFGEVLSAYRAAFLSWIKIGIPVSVLLAAVLVVLLLRLHERVRTGGCFALSSLLATGIASGIAGFVLQFGIHYDIPEQLPAYQAFAEAFFKSPSIVLWVNGFCLALLSVIGLAILGRPKEKNEVTD